MNWWGRLRERLVELINYRDFGWGSVSMDSNFEKQKDNRIKANNAFNEFMDCYKKQILVLEILLGVTLLI